MSSKSSPPLDPVSTSPQQQHSPSLSTSSSTSHSLSSRISSSFMSNCFMQNLFFFTTTFSFKTTSFCAVAKTSISLTPNNSFFSSKLLHSIVNPLTSCLRKTPRRNFLLPRWTSKLTPLVTETESLEEKTTSLLESIRLR
ncbi:unnamed protein product [Amaranthus hypochondriacus]